MSQEDIRRQIAAYLEFEREEGCEDLEVSPETARAIRDLRQVSATRSSGNRGPAAAADAAEKALGKIAAEVAECTRCMLHEKRTRTVPGQGSPAPEIVFVGEGPGADEDRQGLAFVGRAGKLLTKMIAAMGYTREEVFIGNVVKCRPPGNRAPLPDEMDACLPYLRRQVAVLKPKVIVTLGATAAKGLLGVTTGITRLRGQWHSFEGVDVMPTFHPAYLLRNPSAKHDTWEDLKAVLTRLGRKPPPIKKKR